MTDESPKCTSRVCVQTSPNSRKDPPPWMAQAVMILTAWQSWGLAGSLRELRWARQSKAFEAVDLVLVLLLFSLSNERSVRAFFKHLGPHGNELAALWGRGRMPTRSGFMAMLKAVNGPLVDDVRPLFCPTSRHAFLRTACAA